MLITVLFNSCQSLFIANVSFMLYFDGEHLAWDFVSRSCFNLAIWVFYKCLCCLFVFVFVFVCICSCECLSYRV